MPLSKKQRQEVYAKTDGVCYYCGHPLPDRWHADHFKPVLRGCGNYDHETDSRLDLYPERDTIENRVPACPPCNLFKSTHNIEFWRSELEAQVERLRGKSAGFKALERFGIIELKEAPIKFWFELFIQHPNGEIIERLPA